MAMQVINKKFFEKQGRLENPYISILDDGIFFTKAACARHELEPGKFVHFINDGKTWDFYVNQDPDGFPVCSNGKRVGLKVSSKPLVRMLMKSINCNVGDRFYILDTTRSMDGNPLIEILTHKKVEL